MNRLRFPYKKKEKASSKKKTTEAAQPRFLSFGTQDQIVFTKRLSMILRAGMPILEGLTMLADETRTKSSAHIFKTLAADVSTGQLLSASLAKFNKIFGSFTINIIRVGETSGTLPENLEYLSQELKKKQELRRKVVGALMYPALIVIATLGITVLLTVYIFPKILPIFKSVHATLPLSTRMLIWISSFLSTWGWLVLLIIFVLTVAFIFCLRFPRFHYAVDTILVRLPIFGKLSQYYNCANICRTLAILLKSGAPIVQSVELIAASSRNLVYCESLLNAADDLSSGQKIASTFKKNPRLYPSIMTQMVFVGESTGNLTSTLDFLSLMYEDEITELTKNFTSLLEPILMITMGIIVGFIAVSIITPIYSITQSLTPH